MNPDLLKLIESVLLEAIKILGPAAIATYATYKATKTQFDLRIAEIEKNNEYKTRETLYLFYKEKQEKIEKGREEAANSLGKLFGHSVAVKEDAESDDRELFGLHEISYLQIEMFPIELKSMKKQLEKLENKEFSEFDKFDHYLDKLKSAKNECTYENIKSNFLLILEIYSFLEEVNQLLLDSKIEKLFNKYIKNV